MSTSPGSLSIWLSPAQLPLARAIAQRWGGWAGGLPIAASAEGDAVQQGLVLVGSNALAQASSLASELNAPRSADDLRATLASMDPGTLIILDPGIFAGGESSSAQRIADHDLLQAASARGVRVLCIEPLPASLMDLLDVLRPTADLEPPPVVLGNAGDAPELDTERLPGWAILAGQARFASSVQAAIEHRDDLGPIRSASVQCLGSASAGSLGSHVFNALDLLHSFMGDAETIDATYSGPADRSLRPLPGDSLRHLRGDLCAGIRFSGSRAASLHASDHAGRNSFQLTLVGSTGSFTASSAGVLWVDIEGRIIEDSRTTESINDLAQRIVEQARAAATATDDPLRGTRSANYSAILSMAHAAMLSARTGEAESPATMLKMAGG